MQLNTILVIMSLKPTCKLFIIGQHILWNASVVECLALLILLRLWQLFHYSYHEFEEEQNLNSQGQKTRKREKFSIYFIRRIALVVGFSLT